MVAVAPGARSPVQVRVGAGEGHGAGGGGGVVVVGGVGQDAGQVVGDGRGGVGGLAGVVHGDGVLHGDPGVAVAAVAVLVMVRAGMRTVTVAVQAGAGPAGGQVLPGAVEVTVLIRCLSPVSGLSTVIER